MPKALLIAEKPSVMNDIEKAYQKIKSSYPYDVDFGCCAGHLIGLCDPEEYTSDWGTPWRKEVLPMIPEEWKKKVINDKFFKKLKEQWENNHYDLIINAGDGGREGQLIQALVYEELGVNVPILRYWADDTTEKTIIKTLNNLVPDEKYKGLTEASYLRLFFDWLIGMNFSRASSLSLNRATRIGRVMTPTLAMICKREEQILNFKPIDYFELIYNFTTNNGNTYTGTLINPNADDKFPSKYAFLSKSELESINKVLSAIKNGTISDVKEEDKINRAPTLFNLSDLQKDCSKRFGFTPAKTLDIAEKLYINHFLSYPRTESKCLTSEQAKEMKDLISKLSSISEFAPFVNTILGNQPLIDKALSSKKYVDDSKVSDHPALTPTTSIPDLSKLSNDEKSVYMAVICRFLGIFMPDNILTQTTIDTSLSDNSSEYVFRSTGNVEKQVGWKEILKLISKKSQTQELNLPKVTNGESVSVNDGEIKEKQTNPPKRYDDASILTAMETAGKQIEDKELEKVLMECAGLGTPATRAEILEKLFEYEYVERKAKVIHPTEQGMEYVRVLEGRSILAPELTAIWEKKLKEVEEGTLTYNEFYTAMIRYIDSETSSLLTLKEVGPYKKSIGKCPKCGKDFYTLGNFYACAGYFEKDDNGNRVCEFGLPKKFGERPLTETDVKALITGQITKPKEYKWKNGTKTTTSLVLKDFKISFPSNDVGKCPKCGGLVFIGKKGYYCSNWAKKDENDNPLCDFSIYGKVGETEVTSTMIREILEQGETNKDITVKWSSGKQFSGKLFLENKDGTYRVSLKPFEKKAIGKCPYCKLGTVFEEQYRYACDNTPSNGGTCLASVPKKFLEYQFNEKDALTFMSGQTLKGRKLKSKKTGKMFLANLVPKIDETKGMIINIEFVNNNKK